MPERTYSYTYICEYMVCAPFTHIRIVVMGTRVRRIIESRSTSTSIDWRRVRNCHRDRHREREREKERKNSEYLTALQWYMCKYMFDLSWMTREISHCQLPGLQPCGAHDEPVVECLIAPSAASRLVSSVSSRSLLPFVIALAVLAVPLLSLVSTMPTRT